jgi:hypothetical protein
MYNLFILGMVNLVHGSSNLLYTCITRTILWQLDHVLWKYYRSLLELYSLGLSSSNLERNGRDIKSKTLFTHAYDMGWWRITQPITLWLGD